MKHALTIHGMHCSACATLVREALEENGAKSVAVKIDEKKQQGKVTFESTKPKQELVRIIEEQGDYTVEN